ncbi:YggS family pyridoxal phosphate-dependent enzyme [Aeromicrobium sp. Leaf350]|uniref:YggS family pyridoxal phosphate-dependent enzyme n=1 Tax=Aeromicrobium sp. Leaf350 TaxID=2876565 RepID=UPI001E59E35A|nr:YggS family pyridoxal phosphate-dependent enzyme [Aeromicrobium sp. Leaf350]
MSDRLEELRTNLAAVEERIAAACADAGRDRSELTLVVVTKTYPAADVVLLAELGVTEVGENRHPEAGEKAAAVSEMGVDAAVRWHFMGGLQTNKAGAVARYADVVHSVDRAKLVASLGRGAVAAERDLEVLLQVDLGPDFDQPSDGRSGAAPDDLAALADTVAATEWLRLGGVMTVAPIGIDPVPVFERLASIAERLRGDHPGATTISAGMSGDLEAAVASGATHLRVGRAILGERAPLG